MFEKFHQLPAIYQGILYVMAGLIMLLYALGFVEKGITLLIILFAAYLIIVGSIKSGLYEKVSRMISASGKKIKKE